MIIKKVRCERALIGRRRVHRDSETSLVPRTGIEPVRLFRAADFKSAVSTNFTIEAVIDGPLSPIVRGPQASALAKAEVAKDASRLGR